MAGTPPNTITDSISGYAALYALLNNDVDIYAKLDPNNAKGAYVDLPARLSAIEGDVLSAGDGDAKIRPGTNADRLVFESPSVGLIWVETDTGSIWKYDGSAWVCIWRYEMPEVTPADAGKAMIVNAAGDGFALGVAMPVGAVIAVATSSPPIGFLECNGAAVSRTSYADLFAEIGDDYGEGDGSTTFNLPDFRGEFLRGWDHGAGVDPDAASRTDRGDGTTGDYPGTKQACEVESHSHSLTKYNSGDVLSGNNVRSTNLAGGQVTSIAYGGNETRPRNVNVMYCIKY